MALEFILQARVESVWTLALACASSYLISLNFRSTPGSGGKVWLFGDILKLKDIIYASWATQGAFGKWGLVLVRLLLSS